MEILHRHRGKLVAFTVEGARVDYCEDDACPGVKPDGAWAHRVRDQTVAPPPPWAPPPPPPTPTIRRK